jgi:lipid II:glycine glycyltransferase (peptidoglycan interpeptide bridge formation enzyme)
MITRNINQNDRQAFNQAAGHPLQSYAWGEFREKTGLKVIRKGVFDGNKFILPLQVSIHPLPGGFNIGYFPKGPMPDELQLETLRTIGQENNCLMIKLEPNVGSATTESKNTHAWESINHFLLQRGLKPGRPLFTKHTFQLDLTKPETSLLKNMHSKTRYNLRLAERRGVKVVVDNSQPTFEWFLKLLFEETVKRQGFYAHTPDYFKTMWQTLEPRGMIKLLRADHGGKVLAVFMAMIFNKTIYYPYGASTREAKNLMAPNLLMWELIRFGKNQGCQNLDMWGALGPNPSPRDPWFGFHRFKSGYGAKLIEFIGTYDLVLNPGIYPFYRLADKARWTALRAKTSIGQLPDNIVSGSKKLQQGLFGLFE